MRNFPQQAKICKAKESKMSARHFISGLWWFFSSPLSLSLASAINCATKFVINFKVKSRSLAVGIWLHFASHAVDILASRHRLNFFFKPSRGERDAGREWKKKFFMQHLPNKRIKALFLCEQKSFQLKEVSRKLYTCSQKFLIELKPQMRRSEFVHRCEW